MRRRVTIAVILLAFTAVVVVAIATHNRPQNEQGEAAFSGRPSAALNKRAPTTKPAGANDGIMKEAVGHPAEAQPGEADDTWVLKGKIVLRADFQASYMRDLGSFLRSVIVFPLNSEGEMDYDTFLRVSPDADGVLDQDIGKESGMAKSLVGSLEAVVQCHTSEAAGYAQIEKSVRVQRHGKVFDLGEIEIGARDMAGPDEWFLTGRLLSSANEPIAGLRRLIVGFTAGDDSEFQSVNTDEQGYFAAVLWRDEDDPPPTGRSWVLQWRYVDDGPGPTADPWSLPLPPPTEDSTTRVLAFGEVQLRSPMVEIEWYIPEGVDGSYVADEAFWLVESGDFEFRERLTRSVKYRIPLPPGTYSMTLEQEWPYLSRPNRLLSSKGAIGFVSHTLTLNEGSVEVLRIPFQPPDFVEVAVETPDGAATVGDLRISFFDAASGTRKGGSRESLSGRSFTAMLMPGENAVVRAEVPGFEPVEEPLPRQGKLTLKVQARSRSAMLLLSCTPTDAAWSDVRYELEPVEPGRSRHGVVSRRGWVERINVAAGSYRLHLRAEPGDAPPEGRLLDPIELELQPGEVREFKITELPKLRRPHSIHVVCGDTRLRTGSLVPGWRITEPDTAALRSTDARLLRVVDGTAARTWQVVERDDRVYHELRLPVRVEVRLGDWVLKQLGDIDISDDGLEVRLDFPWGNDLGGTEPQHPDRVMHLWAPAGSATLRLSKDYPRLRFRRELSVSADSTTVVDLGAELGLVRFSQPDVFQRSRSVATPRWIVRTQAGKFVCAVGGERMLLPAGDYTAKPAFGPQEGRVVAFRVAAQGEVEVALAALDAVERNGSVVMAAAPGFTESDYYSANIYPAGWDERMRADYDLEMTADIRLHAEGLRLDSLLVGVPMRVRVTAARQGASDPHHAAEFTITLQDDSTVKVDAVWTPVVNDGD